MNTTDVQQRAFRRIVVAISALIALLAVGTAGFHLLVEGMTIIDALYMTVITVSTVGFGEVRELSQEARLFTIALIIGGGGLAAYSIGSVAEFVLSGEWRARWNHQRRVRMLAKLSYHIIVCGYGRVGKHVVDDLAAEDLPFVVIDPDPEKVEYILAQGHLALEANASNELALKEAGIDRARGLIATASSDAENVFIVLTARGLRTDLLIVARSNYEESESKLLRAGADRVILPYSITGRRMVTLLLRPHVADFLDEVAHASGLELLLEQVRISPTSPLVGQTLAQMQAQYQFGITILAYKLPGDRLNTRPGASTVLQANAQIVMLGTRDQLQALITLAGG